MKVTRRNMLKAGGALALVSSAGVRAATQSGTALVVYDSRIAQSRAFAIDAQRLGVEVVDVAHQDRARWHVLRNAPAGRVIGLTRWSDYVQARGALEDQRKRLRSEVAHGRLFRWEMA